MPLGVRVPSLPQGLRTHSRYTQAPAPALTEHGQLCPGNGDSSAPWHLPQGCQANRGQIAESPSAEVAIVYNSTCAPTPSCNVKVEEQRPPHRSPPGGPSPGQSSARTPCRRGPHSRAPASRAATLARSCSLDAPAAGSTAVGTRRGRSALGHAQRALQGDAGRARSPAACAEALAHQLHPLVESASRAHGRVISRSSGEAGRSERGTSSSSLHLECRLIKLLSTAAAVGGLLDGVEEARRPSGAKLDGRREAETRARRPSRSRSTAVDEHPDGRRERLDGRRGAEMRRRGGRREARRRRRGPPTPSAG